MNTKSFLVAILFVCSVCVLSISLMMQTPKTMPQKIQTPSLPVAAVSPPPAPIVKVEATPEHKPHSPVDKEILMSNIVSTSQEVNGDTTIFSSDAGIVTMEHHRLPISCNRLFVTVSADLVDFKAVGSATVDCKKQGLFVADVLKFNSRECDVYAHGDIKITKNGRIINLENDQIGFNCQGTILNFDSDVDKFNKSENPEERAKLIDKIRLTLDEKAMGHDMKFYLALKLLQPHIRWMPLYDYPKAETFVQVYGLEKKDRYLIEHSSGDSYDSGNRWSAAHRGVTWMLPKELRRAQEERRKKSGRDQRVYIDDRTDYFWILKDRSHPDVSKAELLLKDNQYSDARNWLNEIKRNNTILTCDVMGAYEKNKNAPFVIDVRGADQVNFRLLKVSNPARLAACISQKIGKDFIYRDYSLRYIDGMLVHYLPQNSVQSDAWAKMQESLRADSSYAVKSVDWLELADREAIHSWTVKLQEAKSIQSMRGYYYSYNSDEFYDNDDDDDDDYYDDADSRRSRLKKSYLPDPDEKSSWTGNRVVEIPGDKLSADGIYILIAEANGQEIGMPINVNPFQMTLGKCRDGAFVQLYDPQKDVYVQQAEIHTPHYDALKMDNLDGVIFVGCRVKGQFPFVATSNGRYAIGGFGAVFDGIYAQYYLRDQSQKSQMRTRERRLRKVNEMAVYEDRYAAAAITDRPTYRPGQTVKFKFFLRKLVAVRSGENKNSHFRDKDFELLTEYEMLQERDVSYIIYNSRNSAVSSGTLKVTDFGTASAECPLSSEANTGNYSITLRLNNIDRILPNVFSVECYRRPNIKINIEGVPENITLDDNDIGKLRLDLNISAQYYFGKPLSGKPLEITCVDPSGKRENWGMTLDENGQGKFQHNLMGEAVAGDYTITAATTDDSNQTVSTTRILKVRTPTSLILEQLPAFVALNQELAVPVKGEVSPNIETNSLMPDRNKNKAPVLLLENGVCRIKFQETGCYVIKHGKATKGILVYDSENREQLRKRYDSEDAPQWVNLSRYRDERYSSSTYNSQNDVIAIIGKNKVNLGEKMQLLVRMPYEKASILFTMEGLTINDYVIKEVVGNKSDFQLVEIPINKRLLPNFFITARYLRKYEGAKRMQMEEIETKRMRVRAKESPYMEGDDPRWCRIDVIDPQALPSNGTLKVEVRADKKDYQPGEEVKVSLKATDLQNNPRMAELSLAAVDESVFSFRDSNYDPLIREFNYTTPPRRFLPKMWRQSDIQKLSVEGELACKELIRYMQSEAMCKAALDMLKEERACLASRNKLAENLQRPKPLTGQWPVADVLVAEIRSDFSETAAWMPHIVTNEKGEAQVSFKLPDSLTEFRLTSVGITADTKIGIGRDSIKVSKPVAAQVFVPRFAVLGDRLLITGLLHNNTDMEQNCNINWEVSNAETSPEKISGETLSKRDGHTTVMYGQLMLPAKSQTSVSAWLTMNRAGSVQTVLKCGNKELSDAVTTSFEVYPNGRPKDLYFNGEVGKGQIIELPENIVPQTVKLNLSNGCFSNMLDGLGYLVEYPYGCVEQTMSRFLPAVMVQKVVQDTVCTLPADVSKKLPDVLKSGLDRLYKFQHGDGGWGWWENDATNPRMTAYVMYGLAQCRENGININEQVFRSGAQKLESMLANRQLDSQDAAWAYLAFSISNNINRDNFNAFVAEELNKNNNEETLCLLALATNKNAPNDNLPRIATRLSFWKPQTSEGLALKLKYQLACKENFVQCKDTAIRLIDKKQGCQWEHTRATSAAIDALAEFSKIGITDTPAQKIMVKLNGREIINVTDKEEFKKHFFTFDIPRDKFEYKKKNILEITTESAERVRFSLIANAVELLDKYPGVDKGIAITRTFTDPEGKVLAAPPKVGDVVMVTLKMERAGGGSYVIFEDPRPAGFEYVDSRVYGKSKGSASNIEFRDNKLCIFFTSLENQAYELQYFLRAESPGVSHVLPGKAYQMYNANVFGETKTDTLESQPGK